VARQADISPSLIYRWRRELAEGDGGFARVMVAPDADDMVGMTGSVAMPALVAAPSLPPLAAALGVPGVPPADTAMIEVEIEGKARVRLPATATPELAAAILRALAGR
jgi:transposase